LNAGAFVSAQEILTSDEYSIPKTSGEIFWYRSNSSGLALEYIPSRLAALRNEYCLSVERIHPLEVFKLVPAILIRYYDTSFSAELRIIYENGEESRRQWIFRDDRGNTRLTSSGSRGFLGGEKETAAPHETSEEEASEKNPAGFIEIREWDGSITRELRFDDDLSEWEYQYLYKENILISAETFFKEAPLSDPEGEVPDAVFVPVSTDFYRYSRSGSLRAIDRTLHEGSGDRSRASFPRIRPGLSISEEFFSRGNDYSSGFLLDMNVPGAANVNYTLDSRGRILSELWKDEDGRVVGEFKNTWSGDRLVSVLWKSDNDERFVEYTYDSSGNRIAEKNYRQGILERSVTGRDGRETEEIYMDGKLILRAYWENGLKVSEERILPSGTGSRPQTQAPGEKP